MYIRKVKKYRKNENAEVVKILEISFLRWEKSKYLEKA